MSLGVVLFIIALLFVIMVHEAGHFVAAKLLGFKATKFFIGFGPTLWSFRKGETEYGVKLIPAGGFVKIVGMNPYEDVPPEDEPRSYPNKPRWQRAIMIAAGPATHWPLAFLILTVTAMTVGFPTGEATNVISELQRGSAALEGGVLPDDRVVEINGSPVSSWGEIRGFIRDHAWEDATFTVVRDGERVDLEITLDKAIFEGRELVAEAKPGEQLPTPTEGQDAVGYLGVSPAERYDTLGFGAAVVYAGSRTARLTGFLVTQIGAPFTTVFNGDLWEALQGDGPRTPEEAPVGIVGAGRIAGETVQKGRYTEFIGLMVGLTIFVGLINLLPLPPLDGGHLAVIGYEVITRRTVDIRKLIPVAAAVISFFVLLFFAVLYLDLARPLQVPL